MHMHTTGDMHTTDNMHTTDDMRTEALAAELEGLLGPGRVLRGEPMSDHTTFQIGGPAELFVSPRTEDEVAGCIRVAQEANVEWRVLGCGSNVLVSDAGLGGLCVHLGGDFSRIDVDAQSSTLTAQAGATNKEIAEAALGAGLTGYEFASGIPGSVGGAAYMNAGAYDGEFKDVCVSVRCLTLDGEVVEVGGDEAEWRYRHSMMMDAGWVVLSAKLQLAPFDREAIRARIEELTERRESRQPLDVGSAGSTFKRPPGYYAGPLIQDAGMQGHRVGGAMVSEKHAGFVVNMGGATASDVRAVIEDVQNAVFGDAGVMLECEVRMWGFGD